MILSKGACCRCECFRASGSSTFSVHKVASWQRDNASATWFDEPGVYLMTGLNSIRVFDHLACFPVRFLESLHMYVSGWWSVNTVTWYPYIISLKCLSPQTRAKNSKSVAEKFDSGLVVFLEAKAMG